VKDTDMFYGTAGTLVFQQRQNYLGRRIKGKTWHGELGKE